MASVAAAGTESLRRRVAQAWAQAAGAPPAPGISFQEAGGDSLGLMEVVFALERGTGRSLPLDRFDAGMTFEAMLAASGIVVPDRTAASPVFLCPASNGDSPYLAHFRRLCGIPFVTLRYPGWRARCTAGFGLETMVAHVLLAVAEHAPSGAVRLAGTSMGGLVAYAAAAALEAQGRTVGWLAILDAPAPGQPGPDMGVGAAPDSLRAAWWTLRRFVARDGSAARRWGHLAGRSMAGAWASPFRQAAARSLPAGAGADALGASTPGRWTGHYLAEQLRIAACRAFQAPSGVPRLRAPATLFRCEAMDPEAAPDYGWTRLVERVTVIAVPGHHFNRMMEPHVHRAAELFMANLPDG